MDAFVNIGSIYGSYRPTIKSEVWLLKADSENQWSKRSLLPSLGDALKWLTGTATTRDTWEIKQHVNQLIQAQSKQQETLVHFISVLNVTRYAAQVNKQKLNEIMDVLQRSSEDLDRLFNITEVLTQHITYQQMYTYMCIILAYLRDSLTYMRQVAIHMMDFVDAATTNVLSPDIFPVADLRNSLRHIESELPPRMHPPISSDNTLHFYLYLNTHVLIEMGSSYSFSIGPCKTEHNSFKIYKVSSLPVPHTYLSPEYKANNKYIGVRYDDKGSCHLRSAIQNLSECQWTVLQDRCTIPTLANMQSCMYSPICQKQLGSKGTVFLAISHMPHAFVVIAVTSKLWIIPSNFQTLGLTMIIICSDKATSTVSLQQPFHILRLSSACSATSRYLHLPHVMKITLW